MLRSGIDALELAFILRFMPYEERNNIISLADRLGKIEMLI